VGAYPWYVLGLLLLVYTSNHIDRQILMILLEPIKKEFELSDFQMGLLTGPAFGLFYVIAGIPIARWADSGSRKAIIAISVAAWSLLTALSGATRGFASLALLRVGVGIGEAGCTPPSHSLISDYFPISRRARAMGIFMAGTQAGAAFGWLLGGWLFVWVGWRWAFFAVGIPGILLAALVALTVREPVRGAVEQRTVAESRETFTVALRSILGQRSYVWLQVAAAFHAVSGYGLFVWLSPFLIRVHGLELHVIGSWLGSIAIVAGVPGIYLGGLMSDRLGSRDARWYVWIPALSAFGAMPFTVLFLFLPGPPWIFLAFAAHSVLNLAYTAPIFTVTQSIVRLRTRALAVAVHFFFTNVIGLGLGPVLVGVFNDVLRPSMGDGAIRYTLLGAASTNLVAGIFYLVAARTVKQDIETAAREQVAS